MEETVFLSSIRGLHVYQTIWTPEDYTSTLICRREPFNIFDLYAVAVINDRSTILRHVPCNVSAVFSTFLFRPNTEIICNVTGNQRLFADLPQGGLELPCCYVFKGKTSSIQKVRRMLSEAPTMATTSQVASETDCDSQPCKKMKTESTNSQTQLFVKPVQKNSMVTKMVTDVITP